MAPRYYTIEEVAELTQMSQKWLWRQCRESKIPHHRFGSRYRFSEEDLPRLAAETRVEASESAELVPSSRG